MNNSNSTYIFYHRVTEYKSQNMRISLLFTTLFFAAAMLSSCNENLKEQGLRHGDLLFQDLNCGELCDAIEKVTDGVNGRDFSHCAMVVEVDDTLKIVEAIGGVVQVSTIQNFYSRSGDTSEVKNIVVGRMKTEHENLIDDASAYALQQVGAPYDDAFIMNNGMWYCSELIYESYKHANKGEEIFQLFPMTFKDPDLQDYFPAWITYYEDLGQPIPEGEPGLNPGSISRSDKIDIVVPEIAIN